MSVGILARKLYIPPPRLKIVLRSRLIEKLNEGLHRKLTLLSAPAGFGKITLISDWVTSFQGLEPKVGVAWLTLEEGDKDLTRFLADLPLLSSGRLQQVLVCPTTSKQARDDVRFVVVLYELNIRRADVP